MVIGALSRQSNPADKSKCRIKSGKLKALAQPQLITIGQMTHPSSCSIATAISASLKRLGDIFALLWQVSRGAAKAAFNYTQN